MSRMGKSVCRVLVVIGLTILLVPNIAARKNPPIGPSGHDIFMNRCAACHGEDGKGNGPAVGALKIAPADLTSLTQRNGGAFPAARVKEILGGWADIAAHGSREMPIWGDLFNAKNPPSQQAANEQFKSLVVYLESIQQ